MDKTKLKGHIKNFATNVGMATAMFCLAATYLPLVLKGQGYWALLICDVICFCGDTFFAVKDWKEIKTMLAEPKEVEKSAE